MNVLKVIGCSFVGGVVELFCEVHRSSVEGDDQSLSSHQSEVGISTSGYHYRHVGSHGTSHLPLQLITKEQKQNPCIGSNPYGTRDTTSTRRW